MSTERPIPRFALTRKEAADSLGISVDSFDQAVRPHLRVVRFGSKSVYPAAELERWVSENASLTLPSEVA